MKTILAIPESKDELKAVWTNSKKKIIGGAVAVGAFIAGAILAHDKLSNNGDISDCDGDTAGYLAEGSGNEEDYQGDPDDEEDEEENEENEADAE